MDPREYMRIPFPPLESQTQALSSDTFKIPPLDGSLTISELFDWQAEHSPNHPVYEYAEDDGSIVSLKYPEVLRAIHHGAKIILETMPMLTSQKNGKRPVVAIVSNADTVTYNTMTFSVIRAAMTVFPISPRNSAAAVAHLLRQVQVEHILVGREPAMQELVASAFDIMRGNNATFPSTSPMPRFEDLYSCEPDSTWMPLPPMEKQGIKDVSVIIHSSGSTAFPKPISWSNYVQIATGRWPYYHGRDMTGLRMSCHATPMYHGSGVSTTFWTVTAGLVLTMFKPQSPARKPAPESTLREAIATASNFLSCAPSMLEEWCKIPEQVEWIQRDKEVIFGGGPLAQEVGDLLARKGVNLFTNYGCTEYGLLNSILPKKGPGLDWAYFEFSPKCGAHFVPLGDDTYRLVLVANEYLTPSVMNTTVDGVGAYDTNDIVSPHPTKEGLWKVVGRADEQIMHSTGEKTNPAPLEPMLNQDPHVEAAVMFGRGRFQPGVLIDPKPDHKFDPTDEAKLETFRNIVWPTVEKVNHFAPQHSRIFKEMIIVSSPSKPFTYTAKNTARRPAIINDYESEIEALYKKVEETTQAHLPPPTSWSIINTTDFLRSVIHHVMAHPVSDTDDLFHNGCDSLQATWIRNSITHALRQTTQVDTRSLPGNFVYQHPSIKTLATFIFTHARSDAQQPVESTLEKRFAAMHALLDKYGSDFPIHTPKLSQPAENTVIVTGTTGGLGAALLAALVENPSIYKVYAVNRKGSIPLAERQRQVLHHRGYDADRVLDSGKVVLIEANMDGESFGLSSNLYEEMRNSMTHIIHNAWPVDFNVSLGFFEPSVRGLRNLINLSLSSPFPSPPAVLFLSSIGILRNVNGTQIVPEQPVDASTAVGMGYTESKWVGEQLLQRASNSDAENDTSLRSIALRLGQITGSSGNGAWNTTEHVPAMVKSSQYIDCMPDLDAEVSWIPVDAAARAILEMVQSPGGFSTYHLIHPRPVPWRTLFRPMAAELGINPAWYRMWIWRLRKSKEWFSHASPDEEVEQMKRNPALKIIDFFERANPDGGASAGAPNDEHHAGGPVRTKVDELREVDGRTEPLGGTREAFSLPRLSVADAIRVAPSLQEENLPRLTANDALKWLKYWRSIGFIR